VVVGLHGEQVEFGEFFKAEKMLVLEVVGMEQPLFRRDQAVVCKLF